MQPQETTEVIPQGNEEISASFTPSFLELAIKLVDWKSVIFSFVGISTAVALVVSLLLPKMYTATARIMPPQQSQPTSAAALMQANPLAAAAGRELGLRNPSDLFIYILRSSTAADDMIDRFKLMQVYDAKLRTTARASLAGATQIVSGKEGGITIAVTDRDPQRAADLANGYVDELRKLTQTLAVTEAGKRRLFFEQEVQKATDELSQAELELKQTQERTGLIQLDSQSKAMIDSLTNLHARVAMQEAQVEAMQSYATPENPDLVMARRELAAMRGELGRMEAGQGGTSLDKVSVKKVPESALEYVRRVRQVKYHEALLDLLTRQYEVARIDEGKDAAVIQVLDKAEPPELKSSPHRAQIVLIVAFVSFLFAIVFVLVAERVKADPAAMASVAMLKAKGAGR